MFGRKGLQPQQPARAVPAVAAQLNEGERLRQECIRTGRILYDLALETVAAGGRVKIEDLLAALAYNGGYSCSFHALAILKERGTQVQQSEFSEYAMPGTQTKLYFGDLPNVLLFEGRPAMLGEFLHKACGLGASFTMNDMIDVVEDVVQAAVEGRFGALNVPQSFQPSFEMQRYIDHLHIKFQIILEMSKLPLGLRPIAYGHALAHAIEAVNGSVRLDLAIQLVTQCAVIAAKLDPNPVYNEAVFKDPDALRIDA